MEAKQPDLTPKGIGAILTHPDGEVLAHAFDFHNSGFGGFKLWEAQRIRVKKAVIFKFIASYTYADVAKAIDEYDAEKIVQKLCREHKYRLTYVNVGHDIEDRELNR